MVNNIPLSSSLSCSGLSDVCSYAGKGSVTSVIRKIVICECSFPLPCKSGSQISTGLLFHSVKKVRHSYVATFWLDLKDPPFCCNAHYLLLRMPGGVTFVFTNRYFQQTNRNASSLNLFYLYQKLMCSLDTADKFTGYIHSQYILKMNHQWLPGQ